MGNNHTFGSEADVLDGLGRIWDNMSYCSVIVQKYIAIYVLCYIFNGPKLRALAQSVGIKLKTGCKKEIISENIVVFFSKLYKLSKSTSVHDSFTEAKRRWKQKYLLTLLGPYPIHPAVNDSDPFCMDPISEIEQKYIFSYKDSHDKVYAFDGRSLFRYFVTSESPMNPFTREVLPVEDLTRLIKVFGSSIPEYMTASTPRDAFTTLAHELNLHVGIYVQVDDLLRLTGYHVQQLFLNFRTASGTSVFMCLDKVDEILNSNQENIEQQLLIVFATEFVCMIKSDHTYALHFSCVMCVILAYVMPCIRASIPNWVYDAANM